MWKWLEPWAMYVCMCLFVCLPGWLSVCLYVCMYVLLPPRGNKVFTFVAWFCRTSRSQFTQFTLRKT